MANPTKNKEIALNGKLRTYEDPASIGPNDFVSLVDMRYTETHPKTVNGMSVITDTGLASNITNFSQFRRAQPSENHVLAHAGTSIYDLSAAAGVAGGFGSSIWTDTAAGGEPRFAYTNGLSVYANGVGDTCVYGGDEYPVGAFIVTTSAAKYDYSDAVGNTKTDAPNLATLKTSLMSADDSTILLLHCNGTNGGTVFTDSSPTPKTVTAFAGAVTSNTQYKFGTTSGYFPGTGYLTVPDDTWADLSGGVFTIDAWVYPTAYPTSFCIYHQNTVATSAADYIEFGILAGTLVFTVVNGGVATVYLSGGLISANVWTHVAVVENGDAWYLFVNGQVVASSTDTDRAEPGADAYDSAIHIGVSKAGGTLQRYFTGYIDEFRLSNTYRWTDSFSVPTVAYGDNYASTVYLGAIMPLAGVKIYVVESGGKTVDITVNEWGGSGWGKLSASVTSQLLADNTAYSITWDSTAATSKMREYNKTVMYWYQLVFSSAVDFNDVTISQCTVRIPFQQIRDFWNGDPWTLGAFLTNLSGSFQDNTAAVSDDAYDSGNDGSYAKLVSLTTSDFMAIGATQRLMGVYLQFAGDKVNATDTLITMYYYNGTDTPDQSGAWTPVNGLVDGTKNGNKCFNKSGFITWSPPTIGSEFKSSDWTSKVRTPAKSYRWFPGGDPTGELQQPNNVSPESNKGGYPLYYYKIMFTGATTSANIHISYAYGIPAQKTIKGFKFPLVHQDRLWLCGDMQGEKNYVLASAYQSPTVLGYDRDVSEFWIGDDTPVVAGTSLFTRYGTIVSDVLILCKQHETYVIDGDGPDTYRQRMISGHIGCIAPLSFVAVPMGDDAIPGTPRNIAIWLSQQGVMAFDGNNFVEISKDIHDRFDPAHANYIGSTLTTAAAYYDPVYAEYHLIIPGSSEYVYDVARKKWYTMNRGSYPLRCGLAVYDTNGLAYTYGASGTKLYRLENGSTMAGEAFTRSFRTGDMALPEGSVMEFARINWFMLIGKVLTTDITQAYYVDSAIASSLSTTITSTNSGKRLMNVVKHNKDTQATFHGFEFSVADVFEPLYLALRYTIYPREQA